MKKRTDGAHLVLQVLDAGGEVVDNPVGLADVHEIGDLWRVCITLDVAIYSGPTLIRSAVVRLTIRLEERENGLFPSLSIERIEGTT